MNSDVLLNNQLIMANVMAIVTGVLLQGDGAAYSIPEEYKENPNLLSQHMASKVRDVITDGGIN